MLEALGKALVGEIDEGHQAALDDDVPDFAPLLARQVGTCGVVAAGVQQQHGAGRQRSHVIPHALEIHAPAPRVVVRIRLEREARAAEQRLMVRPGRVAHVDDGPGSRDTHEFRAEAQRTATADRLYDGQALAMALRQLTQRELGDQAVELEVACRADVGLGLLLGRQAHRGTFHRLRHGRLTAIVAVHTDAEVDFLRGRVGAEGRGNTEDRVGRQAVQGAEYLGHRGHRRKDLEIVTHSAGRFTAPGPT